MRAGGHRLGEIRGHWLDVVLPFYVDVHAWSRGLEVAFWTWPTHTQAIPSKHWIALRERSVRRVLRDLPDALRAYDDGATGEHVEALLRRASRIYPSSRTVRVWRGRYVEVHQRRRRICQATETAEPRELIGLLTRELKPLTSPTLDYHEAAELRDEIEWAIGCLAEFLPGLDALEAVVDETNLMLARCRVNRVRHEQKLAVQIARSRSKVDRTLEAAERLSRDLSDRADALDAAIAWYAAGGGRARDVSRAPEPPARDRASEYRPPVYATGDDDPWDDDQQRQLEALEEGQMRDAPWYDQDPDVAADKFRDQWWQRRLSEEAGDAE